MVQVTPYFFQRELTKATNPLAQPHPPPKRTFNYYKVRKRRKKRNKQPPTTFSKSNTAGGSQRLSTTLVGANRRPTLKISHRKRLRKMVGQVCPSQATIQASNPRQIRAFRKLGFSEN